AMASAAVAMRELGFQVTGSDQNVYPPMSTFLENNGIQVMNGYAEKNLSHKPDLVVIGNAISRGNPDAEAVLEHRMRYSSLPEVVREFFTRGKRAIVVAGTHGKTTTSALLAWVFEHNGLNPSFLIGGLPLNFQRGARFNDSKWIILEGDEYDTAFFDKRSKFVHYLPEIVIINNIEFDHADIFRDLQAVQTAFEHLIRLIPRNGLLIANGDDPNVAPLLNVKFCPIRTFGFGEANYWRATNLRLGATASRFATPNHDYHINLVGEFNVRNALAVVACARHCGLTNQQIQSAFDTFKGVKRRMEIRGVESGIVVIDDFAHHPTAIKETIKALRLRYPAARLWAIFEPRSNTTRRNVFQNVLPKAFEGADFVIISRVDRAEALPPNERLDPHKVVSDLVALGKQALYLPQVDTIVEYVARNAQGGDVVCIFSNGAFDNLHAKLVGILAQRKIYPLNRSPQTSKVTVDLVRLDRIRGA
ncbi:MAG: UDP-N-acetylmuramate:L-alanyl-gamma-D-glutamyl-meso-diaminopimelate ligase, partial [Verrucomicrobiae bacterium]|nr:UDP-N-acetylmuramate:L-alanyl-gamma-D-glutamyl-meso-diaminopimelate ligase [Verrucomicrobiae bacterium]